MCRRSIAVFVATLAVIASGPVAAGTLGTPPPPVAEPTPRHVSGMTAIKLQFVQRHPPQPLNEQARALFDYTNALRENAGLHSLAHDSRLETLAREAGEKMAHGGYFGHTDPNGVTLEHRVRASGHRLEYYGENISFDQDALHAHNAFVHSPDHYKNIVDRLYRKLGTAAVKVGPRQVFFVQIFAS